MSDAPPPRQPSPLDKVLTLFAPVRAGEGLMVLVMSATIFLIMGTYYVLKVVREGAILNTQAFGLPGAELKAYMAPVVGVLALIIIPLYGRIATTTPRATLLRFSMWFLMLCLFAFYALQVTGVDYGIAMFLWVSIINVFVISQFYSLAADIFSTPQGKRLIPAVAIGGSVGAIVGPGSAKAFSAHTDWLILVSAGMFGVIITGLYFVIERLAKDLPREPDPVADETPSDTPQQGGGLGLVFQNPYLLLIAFLILVSNLVNTTGEFVLSSAFSDEADAMVAATGVTRQAALTDLYGGFYGLVNLVSTILQALVVSRIFKYFGVSLGLFVLPLIVVGGYAGIAISGAFAVTRIAKVAENSLDYSLQNTVRQALFLPTTREEKYKAKAAIDVFFVRAGDAMSAGLVYVGKRVIGIGLMGFAWFNVGLAVVWLALAAAIARRYAQKSGEAKAKLPPAKSVPKDDE